MRQMSHSQAFSDEDVREQQEMLDALNGAGGIDRITLDVTPAGVQFRLAKSGREIWSSGPHAPEDVPLLLQGCEVLLNTEFGIPDAKLCQPELN
jgi:hypothetical protein